MAGVVHTMTRAAGVGCCPPQRSGFFLQRKEKHPFLSLGGSTRGDRFLLIVSAGVVGIKPAGPPFGGGHNPGGLTPPPPSGKPGGGKKKNKRCGENWVGKKNRVYLGEPQK